MRRVRLLLARHLWLQLILSVLAASALIMLLFPGRSAVSVVVRTAVTSVGAVVVVLVQRRKERRAAGGSADDVVELDAKLRKGEIPSAPEERRAMRGLVARRLHRMRHRVAALIGLAALFTTVTLLMVFTGTVRQAVGFAVLTVVFVGWNIHRGNVWHRRLRAMEAALSDGSGQDAGRPTPPARAL
ncbi:hypothetical protein JK361_06795 [Streptomyces sp. 5-8]|uniref:Uncharacterized protein n=1 Tax=Streptomyces musisoli TaxID=2802280 RepID=A0ABS1NW24_9ACTN|nr:MULTISPECIES: hypothetical protein [Streptomyces]MBL1104315.1 hypothetical protein [Streptomyces musisoli]MBY8844471.1 hypothetical protein [Streptomyces sp. SP2-10]